MDDDTDPYFLRAFFKVNDCDFKNFELATTLCTANGKGSFFLKPFDNQF